MELDNEFNTLEIRANASGAVEAAREGKVVMIVDVIDMSTAAEAALEAGARKIFGATPDQISPPVPVGPRKIAYSAGQLARKYNTEVVIVAEPRWGTRKEREQEVGEVLQGVEQAGAPVADIVPNLGAQIGGLIDWAGKVVILATKTGGTAFDAAYNQGAAQVVTGTVARTKVKTGVEPAQAAAERAIKLAGQYNTGISVVAASANSYEDILAAEKIGRVIIDSGFLELARK